MTTYMDTPRETLIRSNPTFQYDVRSVGIVFLTLEVMANSWHWAFVHCYCCYYYWLLVISTTRTTIKEFQAFVCSREAGITKFSEEHTILLKYPPLRGVRVLGESRNEKRRSAQRTVIFMTTVPTTHLHIRNSTVLFARQFDGHKT
jgi:hypothetical protein